METAFHWKKPVHPSVHGPVMVFNPVIGFLLKKLELKYGYDTGGVSP